MSPVSRATGACACAACAARSACPGRSAVTGGAAFADATSRAPTVGSTRGTTARSARLVRDATNASAVVDAPGARCFAARSSRSGVLAAGSADAAGFCGFGSAACTPCSSARAGFASGLGARAGVATRAKLSARRTPRIANDRFVLVDGAVREE